MSKSLNNSIIALFVVSISLCYIYISANLHICEHSETYTENTLFYKIEQKDINIWNVLFKNVNIKYEVTSQEIANNYNFQNFRFKEVNFGNADTIDHTRTSNNIKDAVMAHFNDIQRGHFHPNSSNLINPNAHGRGIRSPLDQFDIKNLISLDAPIFANFHISFTNIGLYLTISAFAALTLNLLATNYNKVMAHKWSISMECIYATIHSIVINQINKRSGQNYYPFMYCLFIMILSSNLIGMIPYSFASTSHFVLAFFLSFTIVLGSTILGFIMHKLKFFSLFVPSGCPLGLLPLLVLIEFISFLARNISLGLRLSANILSGHMLLNILSEFTYKIMESSFVQLIIGLIPLTFIMAFSALELGIAFIQSQVFVVLSSSYIKDSLELH